MIRLRDKALVPTLMASLFVLHAALASPFWPRIALGDGIRKDDFLKQRITEGLYPRVIDKAASAVLDLAGGSSFDPSSGTELLRFPDGRVLFLSRDGHAAQPPTSVPPATFAYDWSGTLPLVLSVLGFGFAVVFALRRLYPDAFDFDPLTLLWSAVLSGALLIGISYSLLEWLGAGAWPRCWPCRRTATSPPP